MVIKIMRGSILQLKILKYVKWKYRGNRSVCCMFIEGNGNIKVRTRCHKRDHYPELQRNMYRRSTASVEYINKRDMEDVWFNR